jgi:hypothetical protein
MAQQHLYTALKVWYNASKKGGDHTMSKEIYLTYEEQQYLQQIVKSGIHRSREIIRARVLLMLDRTGKSDHVRYSRTAEYTGISRQAVYNMRNDYLAAKDIGAYLTRKKRDNPPVPAKVDGKVEAQIIALACSKPPEGYSRWSTRLLASKAVELHFVDGLSHTTVERVLKKHNLSLT